MNVADYIREKIALFIMCLVSLSVFAFFLYVMKEDTLTMILLPAVFFAGFLIALIPEYVIKNRYYRELGEILNHLDKRHLIAEILEYPDFCEGRILYDTLKAAGKSMNDEIAKYKLYESEYREYIELWVHEIKTPIAAAELICENNENYEALEELRKVENFVEQTLYYSRSGNAETDCIIREVDLAELTRSLLRAEAKYLIARRIGIRLGDLSYTVRTDAKWIMFIMRQLIANSVKYGGKNLEIFAVRGEEGVSLILKDDGIGIPASDLKRIFDKGFTGENGRRYGRSTGIGLYLCKKMCAKLGARISASSAQGEGTSLEILFPRGAWDE
ncbi:MAG: sensor histidine kinase [Clostridiales Family XIII bacterium]|jgi:signal transduction histidine kinase|nr:sensor histidine kinase [Clostridiales Family XIII bacterium]